MTRFADSLVAGFRRRSSATLAADAPSRQSAGAIASLMAGDDRTRTRDFLEAYADRAWVYACISSEAKAMKQAPMCIVDPAPDGDVEVEEHPLLDLMRQPNPLTRGGLFREEMIIDLETTGNWYSEIVWSLDGVQPAELWRMDPSRTRIVVDQETGLVAGYLYWPTTGQRPVVLDVSQVWHRKYANPLDPYRGVGPLRAALDAAIFDEAANHQMNAFFQNGMRVSGVMTGPEKATSEEIKLARLMLERRHTGRAGHHAVVLRGDWSYSALGAEAKDIDWANGFQKSREDVCAVFNVPPPVAGDFTRSTYSNYEEAVKDFWQGNIAEKYAALDEDITHDILPLYPNEPPQRKVHHDLSAIPAMQEDRDKATTRAVAAFGGGLLTFNESRAEIGAEPADTDFRRSGLAIREIPYGDEEPLIPEPEPTPAAPAADVTDPNAATDTPAEGEEAPPTGGEAGASGAVARRSLHAVHAADPAEVRETRTGRIVDACISSLAGAFADNRDALFALLSGQHASAPKKPTPPAGWSLLDILHTIAASSWIWQALQDRISEITGAAHQLAGEQAFEHASELGLDASWNITDPVVALRLDQLASRPNGVSGLAAAVKQEILELVQQAANEQATIDEIVDRIVAYYPQWTTEKWRAERVARTETGYAYNLAAVDAYREAGFSHVVISDGTEDDDACTAANGAVWTLAAFEANPIEHPNCVRAAAPALPEQIPA